MRHHRAMACSLSWLPFSAPAVQLTPPSRQLINSAELPATAATASGPLEYLPPKLSYTGLSSGGGMFGGVAGAIAVMALFNALDAGDSSLCGGSSAGPDPALQVRVQALREMVEQRRRLEQER